MRENFTHGLVYEVKPSLLPLAPKRGFTLIELLVVVAIISILAALLAPALKSAREQAKGIQCMSMVKQIGLAVIIYSNENNGLIPAVYSGGTPNVLWMGLFAPYLNPPTPGYLIGTHWFRCPSVAPYGVVPTIVGDWHNPDSCWGVNLGATMGPGGNYAPFVWLPDPMYAYTPQRLGNIPNTTFLLGDASNPVIYTLNYWPMGASGDPYNYGRFSHQKGGNFLFSDGRVERITLQQWLKTPPATFWGVPYPGNGL